MANKSFPQLPSATALNGSDIFSIVQSNIQKKITWSTIQAIILALIPPGEITGAVKVWAGTTAPSGYLLCNGQAVSRSTYSALFSTISTTFGSGDGSTTFNVPDARGRTIIGLDNMGASSAGRVNSSSTGGANSTTLGGSGGSQTHTLTVNQMPAHVHPPLDPLYNFQGQGGSNGAQTTGGVNNVADTTGSTGGGMPHNNCQPWLAMSVIIKT